MNFSDADYYFFRRERYTIQYVFRYGRTLPAGRLRRALLLTAATLPPVGARITAGGPRALKLAPGGGVPLREQGEGGPLVDPVLNEAGEALVKLTLTRGAAGDTLGVSFSHFLGDGASFDLFLRTLRAHLHGESPPAFFLGREALRAPAAEAGPLRSALFAASGYTVPAPPPLPTGGRENIFFSAEELTARRALAAARGLRVKENSLVMALLAKRFRREIPLHEGKFLVRGPVDYRARLGLPAGYFGNAVLDAVAAFLPAELRDQSPEEIAVRIEEAIAAVTPARVARHLAVLRAYREQNGLAAFEEIGCPGLLVSNLTRLSIAKLDLGAGPPLEARPASLNPRLAVIVPAAGGCAVTLRRPLAAAAVPGEARGMPAGVAQRALKRA